MALDSKAQKKTRSFQLENKKNVRRQVYVKTSLQWTKISAGHVALVTKAMSFRQNAKG